jgi:hypothetical protein
MLIINADDFGLDASSNAAIVKSFETGCCSSTTLMANMPGFEEACSLGHERRLLKHIGLHLVLRHGMPLTEAIKRLPRFCDRHGRLALSSFPLLFGIDTSEKRVLADEIRAQIARCRANGIPLTHIDSHHHLHNLWPILDVVMAVARSEHIPYVRLARNCGPGISLAKRLYKTLLNRRISGAGLSRTEYFGSVKDYAFRKGTRGPNQDRHSFEVMIHPVLHQTGFVMDGTDPSDKLPLETVIRGIESRHEAVSFSEATYPTSASFAD